MNRILKQRCDLCGFRSTNLDVKSFNINININGEMQFCLCTVEELQQKWTS
jgi:hypothetical protein